MAAEGPAAGSAIWSKLKLALFRFDAESIHHFSTRCLRLLYWFGRPFGQWPLLAISGGDSRARAWPESNPAPKVFNLEFRNRLGLAAGFDKDGRLLPALPYLGFGFAEIGTVTPRPQPGNPRPRLFRDPAHQAIFNRMGFNSEGATVVASRIRAAKPRLPQAFRVGVNVGKNKDTALERAAQDYAAATIPFADLVDYVVVNVSSPNTPGLRSLQNAESLREITGSVVDVVQGWRRPVPVLLKLAPELTGPALEEILAAGPGWGVGGWVLTNTLAGEFAGGPGGFSGKPLTSIAGDRLREARTATDLPIISVGGILCPLEARRRRELGADLLQIYSGWIFNGPRFPSQVARRLEVI